jgi:hypothetical protein
MRLLLHPAALGLALALGAVAVVRIIAHEAAAPAHLVGHALEFGGLYLIGMTGAALLIAWQSPSSARRWGRPLSLYVALGLVAFGATALTDIHGEGTRLDVQLGQLALSWAVLLGTAVVGLWLLPHLNELARRREIAPPLDAHPPAPAAQAEPESAQSLPAPLSAADARQIVSAFERTRDRHHGRWAAPASTLEDPPERIGATLVAEAARLAGSDRSRQRELAEAFVDLVSFIGDDNAELLDRYDRWRAAPDGEPLGDEERRRAEVLLDELLIARAQAINAVRGGGESVLGARHAIWGLNIRVGTARAALDAVDAYREKQSLGFLVMGVWAVASVVMLVFDANDQSGLSVVLLGVLAGAWLMSPLLGAVAIGAGGGISSVLRGRAGGAAEAIPLVLGVALPVLGVVGLTVLVQQLGL